MTIKYLETAATEVFVTDFLSYREYLKAIYLYLKGSLKTYSYKQFSSDLMLSPENASWLIVTGRRKLSPSVSKAIVQTFGLKKTDRQYFEVLVKQNNSRNARDQEKWMTKLVELKSKFLDTQDSKDNLEYFSHWYHPIIREMVALDSFQSDANWISKNLHCRLLPQEVKEALELLETLNLIEFDKEQDRYVQKGGDITPDQKVDRIAAMRYHQKMIELAGQSIPRVDHEEYDVNALTLRLTKDNFSEAQSILNTAFQQIFELEEKHRAEDRLYQVNMQLFPLTKLPKIPEKG